MRSWLVGSLRLLLFALLDLLWGILPLGCPLAGKACVLRVSSWTWARSLVYSGSGFDGGGFLISQPAPQDRRSDADLPVGGIFATRGQKLKIGGPPALADPDQLDTRLGCPLPAPGMPLGPSMPDLAKRRPCPPWPPDAKQESQVGYAAGRRAPGRGRRHFPV